MSNSTNSAPEVSSPGLGPAAARIKQMFEVPVLAAALMVIPVVLIEEFSKSPDMLQAADFANWLIWVVFLFEFTVLFSLADKRWTYTKSAWLDVSIIILSFPLLPMLLATLRLTRFVRLARVLRTLRLLRLAAAVSRAGVAMRTLAVKRGIAFLAGLSFLLTAGFGALFFLIEPDASSVWDGIWWAFVTLTTVGYGDIYPTTLLGRILAMLLMFVGIGFVATLTAAIAAHFIEEEEGEIFAEIRRIHARLDRIEELLDRKA